jgi:hypothetical protein
MLQTAPRDSATTVDRFLDAVRTGTISDCDVWAPGAVLDATVPNWRFHRHGADAIRATYAEWFADPSRFEELQRQPIQGGEVVRYVLAWSEDGVPHTAHHAHFLTVVDGSIIADVVLCGGRWPASLMAEMEAEDA